MIGITVCVDYHDVLAYTLPWNAPHFDLLIVVTSLQDEATCEVARRFPNVAVLQTDVFFAKGAEFNKGAAIEQALNWCSWCSGWRCLVDADIVIPREADLNRDLEDNRLYSACRKQCGRLDDWRKYLHAFPRGDWERWPLVHEDWFVGGALLVFNERDLVLQQRFPVYPTHWRHAGGADTEFIEKWPREKQRMYPWHILHLGEPRKNWFGRVTPFGDGSIPHKAEARTKRIAQMDADRTHHGFEREYVSHK